MDAQENEVQLTPRIFSKPVGGFRVVPFRQLSAVWWAYRSGKFEYLDFRVYLAAQEFDEQRLAARRVRAKNKARLRLVTISRNVLERELQRMVGSTSLRLVKGSLLRLVAGGFISIGSSGLSFPSPKEIQSGPRVFLPSRLAVPRLMLRTMARGTPPAVAATVLGHLIQCVSWRDTEFHVAGDCSASFICKAFGIDLRSVRRARRSLRELGWLIPDGEDDEFGRLPNFEWTPPDHKQKSKCSALSPVDAVSDTQMSPSATCTQLRSGSKNQQPAGSGLLKRPGEKLAGPPRLANVQPADLQSIARLDSLFEEAATRGHIERSPAGRLKFLTAAARASRLGVQNPCGFFAAIVRGRLWHVLTQLDEDRALALVRAHQAPTPENQGRSKAPRQSTDDGAGNAGLTGVADVMPQLLARLDLNAATTEHVTIKPSSGIGDRNSGLSVIACSPWKKSLTL